MKHCTRHSRLLLGDGDLVVEGWNTVHSIAGMLPKALRNRKASLGIAQDETSQFGWFQWPDRLVPNETSPIGWFQPNDTSPME